MREKARGLEIGPCYVSEELEKTGEGIVVVTRLHKGGKHTVGFFLVDTFCLGVKDAGYRVRMEDYDFDLFMERFEGEGMREVPYDEAHNLIYGAIAFAEEAGISPDKSFTTAQYVLEEDTDDIPLIEYTYGKDGMHFLVAGSQLEASRYLPLMKKNLGEGNYRFVVQTEFGEPTPHAYDHEANIRNADKWEQAYTYQPERDFPVELHMENQHALDILAQDEHYVLTDEEVDELLAMPQDSLSRDLEQLLLYAMGAWWKSPDTNDYRFYPAVGHALMLLGNLGREAALDVVLEVLRMPKDFQECVFGDVDNLIIMPTILQLGKNHLDQLMDFMKERGLENFNKNNVTQVVLHVGVDLGRRSEAVEWFGQLLRDIIGDFPNADYTDATLNGLIVGDLVELDARELLPEIKRLYDLDFIDRWINGIYQNVEKDMGQYSAAPIDFDLKSRYHQMQSI